LLPGQAREVEVPVEVVDIPVAVLDVVPPSDVLVVADPAAVNMVALMAYRFSLFGPPHSSELLPPQVYESWSAYSLLSDRQYIPCRSQCPL